MAELSNIDQGSRVATILGWFGRGKRLTVREIASDLIKKFHSEN